MSYKWDKKLTLATNSKKELDLWQQAQICIQKSKRISLWNKPKKFYTTLVMLSTLKEVSLTQQHSLTILSTTKRC